jgi:cbb3-type cytochrome oxidase cytochrome c subunit
VLHSTTPGPLVLVESGCLNCHRYAGYGTTNLRAPDLTHVGRRLDDAQILAVLRCPSCVTPGSAMPSFAAAPARLRGQIASFLAAGK